MSPTQSYGDKGRRIDPRGATGQLDPRDLPRHLGNEMATISWEDDALPTLIPGTGDMPPVQTQIFKIGKILDGKYEIRSVLGSGGMGQVFEARDLGLNRLVAVKAAWNHVGAEPLRREAQVLAAFRHPGLATVHELGNAEGNEFLVMERLSGATLADILARREGERLPIGESLDILDGICAALAPVHDSGLAHADLKPANIMVVPGGRIVLLDFGIARIEQLRAGSARISGSPHYMAPEAIRGAVAVGAAHLVDIYALGVIAFVLLTGAPPFDHPSPVELMMLHMHEAAPRLLDRCPDAPPALDQLIGEFLAKDPADRPADIEVARTELHRLRIAA
jgi:serine/threonine protein kinase